MKKFLQYIELEKTRQNNSICLIASENYVSRDVMSALGSCLTNKYAEGYPKKRYYAGNSIVDEVELWCIDQALKVFKLDGKLWHANVQPYSGSPANLAIYLGLLNPGDKILGLQLSHGGHLTHGHSVSFTGKLFSFVHYGVDNNGLIDYDEVENLALKHKPKLIVSGTTAYSRKLDFKRFRKIADKVGALLLADISHIAGLIAAGLHPDCFEYADVVMTTTHKTLRGPRGAVILCRKEYSNMIDKAVFPGMQGGPHLNVILAKGVAFVEAQSSNFKNYQKQVLVNAYTLAEELKRNNISVVTGGTENHLLLLDLHKAKHGASFFQDRLEEIGVVVNKNTIPNDPRGPLDPSGIRLGTPAVTTRGMKEKEMKKIAQIIGRVCNDGVSISILSELKKEVGDLVRSFPVKDL